MPGAGAGAEGAWPEDAVEVGRIVGAWGVKGWVKVQPHADDPQALLASSRWWLKAPADMPPAAVVARSIPAHADVAQMRRHGDAVVAQLRDVPDRAAAEALRGARIHVPRASFPAPGTDEFYWVDLIGLVVVNRQGVALGAVEGLLETGAHGVLRVVDGAHERLIPFVSAYVDTVDLATRTIRVDWGADY